MAWIERETITYQMDELPFDGEGKLAIKDVSKVRLVVPGYVNPVDVGAWCFSKRRRPYRDTTSERCVTVEIVLDSFRDARMSFVLGYIDYLSGHLTLGKSPRSLFTNVGQFQRFVKWCDENLVWGLDNKESFVKAFANFSEYLYHLIKISEININTAAALQLVITTVAKWIYGDPYGDMFIKVRKIRKSYAATNVTQKPSDDIAKQALQVYAEIFDQLSNFVLNNELFPKKLTVRDKDYWFFPNSMPIVGKSNMDKKAALKNSFLSYNYINGRVRSVQEIKGLSKYESNVANLCSIKTAQKKALRLIEEANKNKYHHRRLFAASMAIQSFIMMFSANTTMSLGQIVNIEWNDEAYELISERQGFKTVKYRAHGKTVSFYISSSFVTLFKKFLELRTYALKALNIGSYALLFFSVVSHKIRPINMDHSTLYHLRLHRSFDFNIKVTTRMWRAYKSDWLIRNTDMTTTSMILQNTPETVMKHYSSGSEGLANKEMTKFFNKLKNNLILSCSTHSLTTSVGQCVDQNNPSTFESNKIIPDCSKPESCLFCDKYRVHADEVDVRKLLSLKHVINITRPLCHNNEHFSELFTPVTERIDNIIKLILESDELPLIKVNSIEKEVFDNEKLDQYWLRKLKILEDLELV